MASETEHKYLVNKEQWRAIQPRKGEHIRQGYLQNESHQTVRVRIRNKRGYITIKGKTISATRPEFEFRIPLKGAIEMLDLLCKDVIEKTRYKMRYKGLTWEVDVFEGQNAGLVVAEIELRDENEPYKVPPWVTENVTGDERYYNSSLVLRPFISWPKT